MMPIFQQLHESVFGTVEQTCLQIILSELVECLRALPCRQIRAIQQMRVNADCAIELARAAERDCLAPDAARSFPDRA